jgi:hypothetical protein
VLSSPNIPVKFAELVAAIDECVPQQHKKSLLSDFIKFAAKRPDQLHDEIDAFIESLRDWAMRERIRELILTAERILTSSVATIEEALQAAQHLAELTDKLTDDEAAEHFSELIEDILD